MKIGELLIKEKKITEEQLNKALLEQQRVGGRIGSILIYLGYIKESELLKSLGKNLKFQSCQLSKLNLNLNIIKLIPASFAVKYNLIPISRIGKTIRAAMINPFDINAIEAVRFELGYELEPIIAAESSVKKALDKYYKVQKALDVATSSHDITIDEDHEISGTDEIGKGIIDLEKLEKQAVSPAQQFVSKIIKEAVSKNTSDFHIEPYDKELRVRFRIDGILHEVSAPNYSHHNSIVTYIKLIGGMKPDERRLPQDGRVTMKIEKKIIDFRIAIIPTIYGEKIAIRILDKTAVSFVASELGMDRLAEKYFLKAIKNPYGIIIASGPSGSGKTTTLYTALSEINNTEINITTAENPVEYILNGINQVQMKEQAGLTFSTALRAYLRQDPNVIMVGEIRDKETAEISIRASLTGHLVLSSVHSNTAAATITRLIEMGIEPFLIASTLTLVISQRLIKKMCNHCKRRVKITEKRLKEVGIEPRSIMDTVLYKGIGCEKCNRTGYKGRSAIFEVMYISSEIKEMILKRESSSAIMKVAINEGMISLREAGLKLVKKQETDIEEIIKATAEL